MRSTMKLRNGHEQAMRETIRTNSRPRSTQMQDRQGQGITGAGREGPGQGWVGYGRAGRAMQGQAHTNAQINSGHAGNRTDIQGAGNR